MNMLYQKKYIIQKTKLQYLFIILIVISLFFGCKYNKLYTISNFNNSAIISGLLKKNCHSIKENEYKYTEKQLVALLYDTKYVLDILSCNIQNYINKSDHKFYNIKIKDEILTEESDDFQYVYKPEDFNSIKTGEYKGYIKKPYLNISLEIDSYANVLSLYKSIFVYLNKIDNKYLPDSNRYEYMFKYYLSKI